MKPFLLAGLVSLVASAAFAQSPEAGPSASSRAAAAAEDELGTAMGSAFTITLSRYTYTEPTAPSISIHGPKIGAEYTGTVPLSRQNRWFVQANVRGLGGRATYDGACAPWLIVPNGASPNGYELTLGDFSPCSESGDADWYLEGRALFGKDIVSGGWGWSPSIGLGLRHLSNATTGVSGYRTDDYLYVPFALAARTRIAAEHLFIVSLEYDRLIHGWQQTRDSALGGGLVPAADGAPAFTIDSLADVSFDQHAGWAVRASASLELHRRWSLTPYVIHWTVGDSPVSNQTVAYTVDGVQAREQFGAYEPLNTTNEFGVKLGLRF